MVDPQRGEAGYAVRIVHPDYVDYVKEVELGNPWNIKYGGCTVQYMYRWDAVIARAAKFHGYHEPNASSLSPQA
jgi:hypothetical protein